MRGMIIGTFALGIIIGAVGATYFPLMNTTTPVRSVVCDELGAEAMRQILRGR